MTVDRELVAATFAKLGDKRATARELGIHENTVRQVLRGLAERCTRCGGPTANGKAYCADCATWSRQRMKRRRQERMRLGLCQECDEQRSTLSMLHCDKHRIAAQDRRSRERENKKRRLNTPLLIGRNTIEKRESSIRREYGDRAVEAWREAEAACELCRTPHGQSSVQIHHVDEDRKNGARSNIAVLCFDCHQATHRLLAVKNREAFLAWFGRRYALQPPSVT